MTSPMSAKGDPATVRVSDMEIWRRMGEEFRATDVRRELAWAGISNNDRMADRIMQRWRKLGWAEPSPTNKRVWWKF